MSDHIKEALQTKKRELTAELARVEKALAAYVGDKPAPKGKSITSSSKRKDQPVSSAPTAGGNGTSPSSVSVASPGNLPQKILTLVTERGSLSADEISDALVAPKGQVATTLSRLARDGRLLKGVREHDDKTTYGTKGAAVPTTDENPFLESN